MSINDLQNGINEEVKIEKDRFYDKKSKYFILLDKWLLISFEERGIDNSKLFECKVSDISPSGKYIKLFDEDNEKWIISDSVKVREVLSEPFESELNRRLAQVLTIKELVDYKIAFVSGRCKNRLISEFQSDDDINYLRWFKGNNTMNENYYLHQMVLKKLSEYS